MSTLDSAWWPSSHRPLSGSRSRRPNSDDGLVTIRWREPSKTAPTLRLQFHVTNTTGLGNVSLPRLEFVDGRVTQRWLAVSVSPDLEFTASTSDLFGPLDRVGIPDGVGRSRVGSQFVLPSFRPKIPAGAWRRAPDQRDRNHVSRWMSASAARSWNWFSTRKSKRPMATYFNIVCRYRGIFRSARSP